MKYDQREITKVYCQDCAYFQEQRNPVQFLCWHPHALVRQDTFLGTRTYRQGADERNATNDCADFAPWRLSWPWLWRTFHVPISLAVVVGIVLLVAWLRR